MSDSQAKPFRAEYGGRYIGSFYTQGGARQALRYMREKEGPVSCRIRRKKGITCSMTTVEEWGEEDNDG